MPRRGQYSRAADKRLPAADPQTHAWRSPHGAPMTLPLKVPLGTKRPSSSTGNRAPELGVELSGLEPLTSCMPERNGCILRADNIGADQPERQLTLALSSPGTLSVFHPVVSRVCRTWMALASWPACQGQQRSLRRTSRGLELGGSRPAAWCAKTGAPAPYGTPAAGASDTGRAPAERHRARAYAA